MLVKVPALDKTWALSNATVGTLVHWVKKLLLGSCCSRGWGWEDLPKSSTSLCSRQGLGTHGSPSPQGEGDMGSRGLGQSDAAQQIKQSLGHSGEGGMLRAGIHAEQSTPTQPRLQPRGTGSSSVGGSRTTLSVYSSHWTLKDFDQQGLFWVMFTCANNDSLTLDNAVLLELACGRLLADCPENSSLYLEHDF